jgi:hypothetical protein
MLLPLSKLDAPVTIGTLETPGSIWEYSSENDHPDSVDSIPA